MRQLRRPVWLIAALVALGACERSRSDEGGGTSDADVANGNDPLRALTLPAPSTRYTSTYWQTQAEQNRSLWDRAVSYCEGQRSAAQGAKPNCGAVYSAQFEIAGRAPVQERPRKSASEMEGRP